MNSEFKQEERLQKLIDEKQFVGSLYVEIWSKDCDQFESTQLAMIPATLYDYNLFYNQVGDEYEGLFDLKILTEEEGKNWKRYERDHRAEQYNY